MFDKQPSSVLPRRLAQI